MAVGVLMRLSEGLGWCQGSESRVSALVCGHNGSGLRFVSQGRWPRSFGYGLRVLGRR